MRKWEQLTASLNGGSFPLARQRKAFLLTDLQHVVRVNGKSPFLEEEMLLD